MFDLEKLKESYCGDLCWLDEVKRQMNNIKNERMTFRDYETIEEKLETAEKLLETLRAMNYVIIETETNTVAEKYYEQIHELYAQMKYDLTTILGINEFWEMI